MCWYEVLSPPFLLTWQARTQKVRAFRGMNNINTMKAFMVLGDLMIKEGDELSDEAVKYKERIAFATMRASIPDWQPPKDWDTLSNAEKHKRLNKLKSV